MTADDSRTSIVILAPHSNTIGAVPRVARSIADGLTALGWEAQLWPWGKRSDDESLFEKTVTRFADAREAAARLADERPDVLLVNTGLDWKSVLRDLTLLRLARGSASCTVLELHGSQSQRLAERSAVGFKTAVRELLGMADAVFVLSTQERDLISGFMPGIPVRVVKNPYDPAWLGQPPATATSERAFRVLFAGRLVQAKGIFELVRAAADTDGRGVLDVVFAGAGPDEQEARRLAEELGISEHVSFTGHLDSVGLADEYARAAVLALPSYSEGFPTVIAEAMGMGLPVVCTRLRGAIDYLQDGRHALFVEPRDVQGLRAALLTLRDDPQLRAAMARSNRELVECFRPDRVAREMSDLLCALARGEASPNASR